MLPSSATIGSMRNGCEAWSDLQKVARRHASLPLDIRGTAFQQQVWRALQKIPAGRTRSYAEVARSIGRPDAMRAVGSACGANPVALVVPCHRVVQTGGGLGGYRWGVERKRELLEAESEARGQAPRRRTTVLLVWQPTASSRNQGRTALALRIAGI